jgi:hypothetical protein
MPKKASNRSNKPSRRLDAIYIDGKACCPLCKTRHFSPIREYSLADANHRDIGMFRFVVNCQDCGNKIVYYKNI